MMREVPLTADIANALPGAAAEGAALVGVEIADSPPRIVAAINDFLTGPQKKSWFKKVDNWNERAMPLGALWGQQLVRQFGWQWTMIVDEDDDTSVVVTDPRRSMCIVPFDYIYECLEGGEVPTVLLAFNMLIAGTIPEFPERTFENIMDGVQHIVPPPR